jgi:hypothetical protein
MLTCKILANHKNSELLLKANTTTVGLLMKRKVLIYVDDMAFWDSEEAKLQQKHVS